MEAAEAARVVVRDCALCERPLGKHAEWHHVRPKSEGGKETVPLHPICHRAIHASLSNAEIARRYPDMAALRAQPEIARFLAWVTGKHPDFHAPTRAAKRDERAGAAPPARKGQRVR
ncbi:MAG: HNH endonuclease [Proteobacteria bacterium SG_bin5]|nr:MAG: HNH endonuclease [Proteobacteria bacterium SG_bin5]